MWGEEMSDAILKKDIVLDLSVEDDGFNFATSISDALVQAESELVALLPLLMKLWHKQK